MPLEYYWKRIGVLIVLVASILLIVFMISDFQMNLSVFAISAYFMEHKMLTTFPTNVTDELIMLLYVLGFGFIVFSKEKIESREMTILKYQSFFRAGAINTIVLVFSIIFIYGGSFIAVLIFNCIFQFVLYLIIFYSAKGTVKI